MRSGQTDLRISRTSINESPGSTYLLTRVNQDVHVHSGYTVVFTEVFFSSKDYLVHWFSGISIRSPFSFSS